MVGLETPVEDNLIELKFGHKDSIQVEKKNLQMEEQIKFTCKVRGKRYDIRP
jgi:hypothetical protein